MKTLNPHQVRQVSGGWLDPDNFYEVPDTTLPDPRPERVIQPPVTLPVPVAGYSGTRCVYPRSDVVQDDF